MGNASENKPRIPAGAGEIQVNFCKNPVCANFGRPASDGVQARGPGAKDRDRDSYTVVSGKGGPFLKCGKCGEHIPIKSNQAIKEEIERLSFYLNPKKSPSCPNVKCPNHDAILIGNYNKDKYWAFGKTKSGAKRLRCKTCGATFSIKPPEMLMPTRRHKMSHKNATIFNFLLAKVPIRKLSKRIGVSPQTIYDKIDFIHRQCLAFAGERERFFNERKVERLYIAVDRQTHIINWPTADKRKNIVLQALGSADRESGYVFAIHVNYDADLDTDEIEDDAENSGDYLVSPPFRKYARVWLKKEYQAKAKLPKKEDTSGLEKSVIEGINSSYNEINARDDVEAYDMPTPDSMLPTKGMIVHSEYTLYAHFFILKNMLRGVNKVRFYLDQESGIRAACLSAFIDKVLEKRCDAFFVRINKNYTQPEKLGLFVKSKREIEDFRESNPYLSELADFEIRRLMIIAEMQRLVELGKWKDRWLLYPFPHMSEPEKAICYLTSLREKSYDYDNEHMARLYEKASLHPIDRFFMQARRAVSMLERPISSASTTGRKWHGYNAYNPAMIAKLLDIYRVYYNFVEVGEDGKTPALRLGLAKGKVDVEDIIYFSEA